VARALSASLPPLAAPFTLRLDRAALWPQGIAVLEACERTAGLAALHADLASQLRLLGLPVQTRPLRPHVTLARHAQGAQAPDSLAAIGGPIEWRVEGYALVHSIAGPPLCYQPIARV
jgi:2'-5' RNA ligase